MLKTVLFETIQFRIRIFFCLTQLNVKAVNLKQFSLA